MDKGTSISRKRGRSKKGNTYQMVKRKIVLTLEFVFAIIDMVESNSSQTTKPSKKLNKSIAESPPNR